MAGTRDSDFVILLNAIQVNKNVLRAAIFTLISFQNRRHANWSAALLEKLVSRIFTEFLAQKTQLAINRKKLTFYRTKCLLTPSTTHTYAVFSSRKKMMTQS